MNNFRKLKLLIGLLGVTSLSAYEPPVFPYDGGAGEPGSLAVPHDAEEIIAWASSVVDIQYGEDVSDEWKVPNEGLGEASVDPSGVVVLGRGGSIVLTFKQAIVDGPGFDFAVFENGLSNTFLELAFVEVSTDGVHFVRFPNYSLTAMPVGGFGNLQPEQVHGYAGKHRSGFGTPFDLSILASAYEAALGGSGGFSDEFRDQLLAGYPFLNPNEVKFVRLIDIPGDGRLQDCEGFDIYDPYPTIITSGFDLDAVAVMNSSSPQVQSFRDWSAAEGLESDPAADTDGDKWSQYMEYLMGSDPRDGGSIPDIGIRISGSPPNRVLILEYRISEKAETIPGIQVFHANESWKDWAGTPVLLSKGTENQESYRIMEARFPADQDGRFPLVRMVGSHTAE